MRDNPGAQYQISIDGVPRTYRDRQDIALQTARFLKSRNPHSVVKLKDLQTGEETVVAFKSGSLRPTSLAANTSAGGSATNPRTKPSISCVAQHVAAGWTVE